MDKLKRTPGQWTVRKNKIFVGDTYNSIATIHVQKNYEDITFKPITDVEMEANAKLIAAAPDLLEALEFIVKEFPYVNGITKAKEAIKKATN